MDRAISIYLGGDIISAKNCTYQSYKSMGLKCPLCNEAVFLREGYKRTQTLRNKKIVEQVIDPVFVHYPSTSDIELCEARSRTQEAKDRIDDLVIKSKNQRLILYNKHLWEYITKSIGITDKELNKILRKRFNNFKTIEKISDQTYKYWRTNLDKITANNLNRFITRLINMTGDKELYKYIDNTSKEYHYKICEEVINYLNTYTAKSVFYKLIKLSLIIPNTERTNFLLSTRADMKTDELVDLCLSIIALIVTTKWINIISTELNK